MKSIKILNVRIDNLSAQELLETLDKGVLVTPNIDDIMKHQKDEEFHDVIYKATDNSKLILLINNLREQMYRYRLEYIKDINKRQELVKEHENIVYVLSNKNVEESKIAVKNHIDNQEMTVSRNLKENDAI